MAETHPGRYTAEAGVFLTGIQLPGGAQVPGQRARRPMKPEQPKARTKPGPKRTPPQRPVTLRQQTAAPPHLTDTEGITAMTEPITRHQESERRGPIMSPAGAAPAHPATGRVRPAPKLLANLIRALPQPRLARPQSGSPPHPISTEGNQPS